MKKRLTIALSIFLSITILSVISYFVLSKNVEELSEKLNKVYTVVAKDKVPQSEYEDLLAKWEESRTLFHIFLVHENISEVETNIESMEKYLSPELLDQLKTVCIRSIYLLEDVDHAIQLSVENIF